MRISIQQHWHYRIKSIVMSNSSMSNGNEEVSMQSEEEETKVQLLAGTLNDLSDRASKYCSKSCLRKFLRARNWNVKKAEKLLKETVSWRASYKPEEIRWDDIALESETGKLYKANFVDKLGRPVLIMRPGMQNTSAPAGQLKQLIYFMENAILNLPPDQDQMVWLIDFNGWSLFKSPSVKTTRDVAYILQTYYPERLGLAILYNPPYIFETFWVVVKPFLDSSTCKKVKFVYANDLKLLHNLFDMTKVEATFGGGSDYTYNHEVYGKLMQQEDLHTDAYWGGQRSLSPERPGSADGRASSSGCED